MRRILIIPFLLLTCMVIYASDPVKTETGELNVVSNSYASSLAGKYRMKRIYQVNGFFVDLSPGLSFISNTNLSQDIWTIDGAFAYKFSAGYFQSFNQWAKVKIGLGFSSYTSHLKGSGEFFSPELTDIDNDAYIETLTVTNADYTINPMYISVPLSFEFGTSNISRLGYYFDVGLEYSYLISDNNKANGSYSAKGTYPRWGLTLENIPELGFYSDRSLESDIEMNKSNFAIKGGAGITIPLSGVVIFKIGLTGYAGINDISTKQKNNDKTNSISQNVYDFRSKYINNPLTSTKGTKSFYTGIEFGFYFSKNVK